MNYLGHLYFSANDTELMYANLYGDFVKGKILTHYSPIIQKGVRLHRAIDHYIDNHPAVLDLTRSLYNELPKISGVAVDLFFDHLLAKQWSTFHEEKLLIFLDRFYSSTPAVWNEYSANFQQMILKMRAFRWMDYYPSYQGLEKACEGVASRLSFSTKLSEAPTIFLKKEAEITACFHRYMEDAIQYFIEYNQST